MKPPAPRLPTTRPVEDHTQGVISYTLDDGNIRVIQTEGDMSRQAVDAWATAVHHLFHNASAPHLFAIYDMSHPRQGITPYGMKKAEETYTYIPPHCYGHVAILFPNTIIFRMAANFAARISRRYQNCEVRLFTQSADALKWLRQRMIEIENA